MVKKTEPTKNGCLDWGYLDEILIRAVIIMRQRREERTGRNMLGGKKAIHKDMHQMKKRKYFIQGFLILIF